MHEDQALAALAALAEPTRLDIFRRLVAAGPDGLAAGQLGDAVGAAPSRLSFHVSVLAKAQLVVAARQSRHVIYRADLGVAGALLGYLLEDCCGGHPAVAACCGPRRLS